MHRPTKKATTAKLVLLRVTMLSPFSSGFAVCGSLLVAVTLAGCDQSSAKLSEWRPEDHQPPSSVVPEGQGAAEESGDPTARAAAALWSMRCASCHGEQGRGDGSARPPGAAPPDFTSAAFQDSRKDEQLYEVIENGRNMMPGFGKDLTKAGIEALIGHLRTLRGD